MNIISPITTLSPGISFDEGTMTMTAPSGHSLLGVKVIMDPDDPTDIKSKSVTLTFLQHGSDQSAETAKFVTAETGLDYHSMRSPDDRGNLNFDLHLPPVLPAGLDILLRLSAEKQYAQKTNVWTFSLKETAPDNSLEVRSLKMVSGDKQRHLLHGSPFEPLAVRALDAHGHGLKGINIDFSAQSSTGITCSYAPLTDENGLTQVNLITGNTCEDSFTVTALYRLLPPVRFIEKLLPESLTLRPCSAKWVIRRGRTILWFITVTSAQGDRVPVADVTATAQYPDVISIVPQEVIPAEPGKRYFEVMAKTSTGHSEVKFKVVIDGTEFTCKSEFLISS